MSAGVLGAEAFCAGLRRRGLTFWSGVPCSYFAPALVRAGADPAFTYVSAANEGAALGIAAGAALAGARPVVLLQNSGFGNLLNPLTSLSMIYDIPVLLFVTLRAWPDELDDEPQHRVIGRELTNLLDTLGVRHAVMPVDPAGFEAALDEADAVLRRGRVAALLISKGSLAGAGRAAPAASAERPLSRAEAVETVAASAPDDEAIVSTTGEVSRELFALRDRPGNFYMQGSMGHAAAIALGVALGRPERSVLVLDGDGAVLMHMGTLSTIGYERPERLIHVILDNEAYATTGNQPTTSVTTRLEDVALACGYRWVRRCATREQLAELLRTARAQSGPACILVKTNQRETDGLPRVTSAYAPADTTRIFSAFLAGGIRGG
jgi:phosphonopyruvate decarboxylase